MANTTPTKSRLLGDDLERRVAAIFQTLGAEVERDVSLAGSQIDLIVRNKSVTGKTLITAIECKAYAKPVGIDVLATLASTGYLLKQRNLIDKFTIVSTNGFTNQARAASTELGIDLLELADLEQQVVARSQKKEAAEAELDIKAKEEERPPRSRPHAFVLMPFGREFEDVYVLGIREVAERLNFTVERADNIEHNDDIVQVVREKIRSCDLAIADTTGKSPNVFYEIGFAHGLDKPTILIGRKGDSIPFDIQSMNVILYDSIVELRDKLARRIRATLQGPST